MKSAFRHHDQLPTRPFTSPLFRQLVTEWIRLNADPTPAATMQRWGRTEALLAGYRRPADIVDAIDQATPADQDALMLALIRLTQAGQQLAGRILLQQMLPKLGRMVLRTAGTTTDTTWAEDRRHIAVAELWDIIIGYPVQRRPAKVAANLALDTLNRITRTGTSNEEPIADIYNEDTIIRHAAADEPAHHLAVNLTQIVTWGINHNVITTEAGHLLTAIYTHGETPTQAAQRLGTNPGTIRTRCSRAAQRLRNAINNTELALTS